MNDASEVVGHHLIEVRDSWRDVRARWNVPSREPEFVDRCVYDLTVITSPKDYADPLVACQSCAVDRPLQIPSRSPETVLVVVLLGESRALCSHASHEPA